MTTDARPADTRCPADAHAIECSPVGSRAPGVCRYCDLGTCAGCGAPMSPEQCAESRAECPLPARDEVYCPACLGEIKGEREAVPEAVEEEASGAQTVRLESDPTIVESGWAWAEKLDAREAV